LLLRVSQLRVLLPLLLGINHYWLRLLPPGDRSPVIVESSSNNSLVLIGLPPPTGTEPTPRMLLRRRRRRRRRSLLPKRSAVVIGVGKDSPACRIDQSDRGHHHHREERRQTEYHAVLQSDQPMQVRDLFLHLRIR